MFLNLIVEAIKRFKQLVGQHYKQPVNGQFEDYRKEVLPRVERAENSSDEEDQNITTEQLKMIVINVCNGNKVAVLTIDIMLVAKFSRHVIFATFNFHVT